MKISILFPTETESATFIERYGSENVSICGIGLTECAAATASTILKEKPDFIILAGIAGAYNSSDLKKGDTVNVIRENNADLGTIRNGGFVALSSNGNEPENNYYLNHTNIPKIFPNVISNSVNTAGTTFKAGFTKTAAIENMEGAAFFAVCRAFGIKYAELRSISNIVGEPRCDWNITQAVSSLAEATATLIEKLQMP